MGESEENVAQGGSANTATQAIPLHRAIFNARRERARHRVDRGDHGEEYSADMSEQEMMDYARDLCSRLTDDAYQCFLQNKKDSDSDKEESDAWSLGAARLASCVRSLLLHPRVHSINVHDLNAANRKVREPQKND